jgi:hypothetical protein
VAGSTDRVSVLFGISYVSQLWFYRVLVFVGPVVAGVIAYRVCIELRRGEVVEQERHLAEGEAKRARVRAAQEP